MYSKLFRGSQSFVAISESFLCKIWGCAAQAICENRFFHQFAVPPLKVSCGMLLQSTCILSSPPLPPLHVWLVIRVCLSQNVCQVSKICPLGEPKWENTFHVCIYGPFFHVVHLASERVTCRHVPY